MLERKICVFPYGITLTDALEISVFPAAEVSFLTSGGETISLIMIVDSGASISALPAGDADLLGVSVQRGKPLDIGGIQPGVLRGWEHQVHVRLGDNDLLLPVVFLENDSAPRVLGRRGLFDRFLVCFDEPKRKSYLAETGSKEASGVRKVFL